MRHATSWRSTPIRPATLRVLLPAIAALVLVGCQPTPTSPAVLPSGGPATFRPTPTPVPGSSAIPSEPPGSGNVPDPSVEVPPPIP